MEVGNTTRVTVFVLQGLSNNPQIQAVLFVTFLVVYLLTLTGNLLMLLVIRTDSHLHTPMYFFLSHLSFLDAFYSSVIVPKLLENLLSKWKTISFLECFAQISLVIFSGATEACLLSVMAYDRFQAVCHPLLYVVTMNKKVCAGLVGASWAIGMGTGLLNTVLLSQQHFCGPNLIRSFACEFPPVLLLACSDPYMSVASILTTMVVLGLGSLALLVGSYTRIILTALGINSTTGWNKIFSTCSSHFLVVTTFYGSGMFRYVIAIPLNVNVGYFHTKETCSVNRALQSSRKRTVLESVGLDSSFGSVVGLMCELFLKIHFLSEASIVYSET